MNPGIKGHSNITNEIHNPLLEIRSDTLLKTSTDKAITIQLEWNRKVQRVIRLTQNLYGTAFNASFTLSFRTTLLRCQGTEVIEGNEKADALTKDASVAHFLGPECANDVSKILVRSFVKAWKTKQLYSYWKSTQSNNTVNSW